jgi:beta-glucosidase
VTIRFEYLHGAHHARVGVGVRRADAFVDPAAKEIAARADVVVVAAGFEPMTESEGYDRTFQLPAGQDELIAAVRAANKRVVVALTSGGGVDMTKFVDHVPAVIETWYAGQEGGTALAEILFGDVTPSGKLPVTFERHLEDGAAATSYYPDANKRIAYKEGVFLGYRHFDQAGKKPLFPFGHGLSYTRFKYAALKVAPETMTGDAPVTVSFDVTNVGARRGAEVAQLYVGDRHAPVPRPPKELKGFAKIDLQPGETRRVRLTLDRRALSYFDVGTKQWRAAPGTFDLMIGSSSRQIELTGKLTLK